MVAAARWLANRPTTLREGQWHTLSNTPTALTKSDHQSPSGFSLESLPLPKCGARESETVPASLHRINLKIRIDIIKRENNCLKKKVLGGIKWRGQ